MVQLPDEILLKIAKACKEPFHVAVYIKRGCEELEDGSGFDSSAEPINDLMNLRSVNKLFRTELETDYWTYFNGQVQIHLPQPNDNLDERARALKAFFDDRLAVLESRIHEIVCNHIDGCSITILCATGLPNLQRITVRPLRYPYAHTIGVLKTPMAYLTEARTGKLDDWAISVASDDWRFDLRLRTGVIINVPVHMRANITGEELTFMINLTDPVNPMITKRIKH